MATFDAILIPATARGTQIATLASVASTAAQAVNNYGIFAINATGDCTIRFGLNTTVAADATDFRIPANTTVIFDMGREFTHFRIFNPTAGNIDVSWLRLSKS